LKDVFWNTDLRRFDEKMYNFKISIDHFEMPHSNSIQFFFIFSFRIFKLTSPEVQLSEELLHASVLSMIEFDDDIFGAGNCFDWNQHPSKQGLFCPFAYRLPAPDQGATLVKDLAAEYHYLGNKSEWFFVPRKNAEKVIMRNEQYIRCKYFFYQK
jgi:hypothetical protein